MPYRYRDGIGTALYGFLGLMLSFRLACKYVAHNGPFLRPLQSGGRASLPVYMYFNPSWSHAHSAFVVALFLWYWEQTRLSRSLSQWLILGLIVG